MAPGSPSTDCEVSPFKDYAVNQVLTLNIIPKRDQSFSESALRVRIRRLHSPRTLSCGMIVERLDEDCPDQLFLKLYDRRFSEQLRDGLGAVPWTEDIEKQYLSAVQTGATRQFLNSVCTTPNFPDLAEDDWDDNQMEAFLVSYAKKLFDTETKIYDAIGDIQGKVVPRLIAKINIAVSTPETTTNPEDAMELLHINGILLQNIDGFSLSDMHHRAPRSEWQAIFDQAITSVNVVGDHSVLNKDVRPGNFIVRQDQNGSHQVFVVDFGSARLRRPDESDQDWGKAKMYWEEEEAVGLVMKKRLEREDFTLRYEPSDRYLEWAGNGEDPLEPEYWD